MSCAGLARLDRGREGQEERVAVANAVSERSKGRGGKRTHEERPAGGCAGANKSCQSTRSRYSRVERLSRRGEACQWTIGEGI